MSLDPTARAFLDQLAAAGRPPIYESTVEDGRAGWVALATMMGRGPDLPRVEDLELDGPAGAIAARLYAPTTEGSLPALVWYHGGGFVIGDIDSYDLICRTLAERSGCAVVSVGYRLAPEHPFPAAVDDAHAALVAVAARAEELGLDAGRLAVGGDSAGGNLACVVALQARDDGAPALAFQLLVYPGTDWRMDAPSVEEHGTGKMLERGSLLWFRERYLGATGDEADWRASPLRAESLVGLPPALVITAECDPIRDYGERWAWRLVEAGVPVTVHRYPGMIHGFASMSAVLPAGAEVLEESARALREALRPT